MLWLICLAQVNISNYHKWELQSYIIILQLSLQYLYIVFPLLKCCLSNLHKFLCLTSHNKQFIKLFFLSSSKTGQKKEKTTAEFTQALTTLASYKHPSQSIRQRCIAMRLARPTIAFLPLPVLCNRRLYI